MSYYFLIQDTKVIGIGECPCESEGCINIEVTQEQYNLAVEKGSNYFIYEDEEIKVNPDYETEEAQKERERLDALTLTPADVERALYSKFNMDFDDLKALIEEKLTGVDMKALNIEFKASLFYRGAKFGNGRLFDVIGNLLGLTSDDLDYLFINKKFPEGEQ